MMLSGMIRHDRLATVEVNLKVLICGVDGYLGWALSQHLVSRGHEIAGVDNYFRRDWVAEMGSQSATPIQHMVVSGNMPLSLGVLLSKSSSLM
jgi:nucleoside-diphosphate-sugar epimerase